MMIVLFIRNSQVLHPFVIKLGTNALSLSELLKIRVIVRFSLKQCIVMGIIANFDVPLFED